jgi:hypothetical protein
MLDILASLLFGLICAADAAVLIGLAAIRPAYKFAAFVATGLWAVMMVVISALGGFAPGTTGPIPAVAIALAVLMTFGLVAWLGSPAFRAAYRSIPLTGLVGINVFRVVGICFLILHNAGALANPFAAYAGWGDLITAVVAAPIALALAGGRMPRGWLIAWNLFGALDLLTAIALGVLSAPGTPFRLFTEAPGSTAMGVLPWVLAPTLLVPMYLLTHLEIAARTRAAGLKAEETEPPMESRPKAA